MIVYKGVSVEENGDLRSWARLDNPFMLTYKPNKIVYPTLGLLFAFDTYENAISYFNHAVRKLKTCEIWEAEAKEAKPMEALLSIVYFSKHNLESFWKDPSGFNSKVFGSPIQEVPQGTVGCTSLKLIKKLI